MCPLLGEIILHWSVCIDDMVMARKDEASLQKVKDELRTKFEIKDPSTFLG